MKRALLALLLIPGVAFAGNGPTKFVSASPTCDTSVYATGELVGGLLTFSGALQTNAGTGYVVSVNMVDKAAQGVDFDVVLFGDNPSSTTFTDQVALDIADGDLAKVIAVVPLAGTASRFAFSDNSVHFSGSLALPIRTDLTLATRTGTVYGALVSRGTPTFAASTDVTIVLGISQD